MQWTPDPAAGFSDAAPEGFYAPVIDAAPYSPEHVNVQDQQADPNSLFNTIKQMIAVRKQYRAFGWGSFRWMDTGTPTVAAYLRQYGDERVLIINNLSDRIQSAVISIPRARNIYPIDILTDRRMRPIQDSHLMLSLTPYRYLWLKL
jgi:maltose alpha-D-glucosyltransferase/alpha-amylase